MIQKKIYLQDLLKPITNILLQDSGLTIFPQGCLSRVLNIVFTKSLIIDCANTWDLSTHAQFSCVNIQGCGSVIRGSFDDIAEEKWATITVGKVFSVSNMTLVGFNMAVENNGGVCMFSNVVFNENRMKYVIDRDWGAAILSTGWVYCVNCTFTNNYAKNGAAIFNQGTLVMENSHFRNNTAYGEGPCICVGDGGKVMYNGENITGNDQVSTVHFAKSMSIVSSTIIAVFTPMVATLAGVAFGFMTGNPFVGVGVGLVIGVAIDGASAAWIISEHYDVNYNRRDTILSLTITSAIAGAMGGLMGGAMSKSFNLEYTRIVENNIMAQRTNWEIVKYVMVNEVFVPGAFKLFGIIVSITGLTSGISYYFTND